MMLDILLKNSSVEKNWGKNPSIFADISISMRALIEKLVKMTKKYQLQNFNKSL